MVSVYVSFDSSTHLSLPVASYGKGVPSVCRKTLVAVTLPSDLSWCACVWDAGLPHICPGAWGKLSSLRAGNSPQKPASWGL